jgi:hypothetical protein
MARLTTHRHHSQARESASRLISINADLLHGHFNEEAVALE